MYHSDIKVLQSDQIKCHNIIYDHTLRIEFLVPSSWTLLFIRVYTWGSILYIFLETFIICTSFFFFFNMCTYCCVSSCMCLNRPIIYSSQILAKTRKKSHAVDDARRDKLALIFTCAEFVSAHYQRTTTKYKWGWVFKHTHLICDHV